MQRPARQLHHKAVIRRDLAHKQLQKRRSLLIDELEVSKWGFGKRQLLLGRALGGRHSEWCSVCLPARQAGAKGEWKSGEAQLFAREYTMLLRCHQLVRNTPSISGSQRGIRHNGYHRGDDSRSRGRQWPSPGPSAPHLLLIANSLHASQ